MTVNSSAAAVSRSGEDGGSGVNSPSGRILPSPWAEIVRGGIEPDTLCSLPSPGASERHPVFSDLESAAPAPSTATQSEGSDDSNNCNAGGIKKSPWNKPSANGVMEGSTTPVMCADSWPALSESTRSGVKSIYSSSESSSKPTTEGSPTVSQAHMVSQSPQKQVKSNSNSHSNPNHMHHVRQRPMRRGGNVGGPSYRPPPPPPPLLPPPPFPLFDMSFANLVPPVLDSQHQPPFKGNSFTPRSVADHSLNRNPLRRNNFGAGTRGDGGPYLNNGYGGRHDHRDRDWRGPRMVPPPPPPPVGGYIRQPHPGPAPFIPPQSLRPYGAPMGYDMGASYLYVPTLPPEPYRGAPPPLLPHAASGSVFVPPMDPPLHVLIVKQIDYYFSDENLVKDNFLRSNMDEEGWVPITLIAGFRRVQNLTKDILLILNSLRDSSIVEIQGEKVRRRNEWRRWVQSSNGRREASDGLVDEAFIQKLTLEASDSSNIANGEVSQ